MNLRWVTFMCIFGLIHCVRYSNDQAYEVKQKTDGVAGLKVSASRDNASISQEFFMTENTTHRTVVDSADPGEQGQNGAGNGDG
mmetsp:Transcript_97346/g.154046  ORF Transcript_97346/g.154046 Transcript_97346/m.154046 type:complete len:84 (+) Transcript_97346:67-318(+)